MSFSANGISLRPGEVDMKILQSWRQALPTRPRPNPLAARAQNKSCVRPKSLPRETQIESLLAGYRDVLTKVLGLLPHTPNANMADH